MKITNHFVDGTVLGDTAGVKVPYTAATAAAYATVYEAAKAKNEGGAEERTA